LEEQKIVETVFEMVMENLFGVYFFQIVTIIMLMFMIFSGKLSKLWDWIMSFRRVKIGAGNKEIEMSDNDERRDCSTNRGRRSTDVCSMHCNITEVIETNTRALEELKNVDKKLIEHDEEVWIMILEDRFYSPYRTKSVRMVSGLTYVWWGLNSDVRKDVLEFKEEYPDVYKDVIACRPELQLGKYAPGRKPENI